VHALVLAVGPLAIDEQADRLLSGEWFGPGRRVHLAQRRRHREQRIADTLLKPRRCADATESEDGHDREDGPAFFGEGQGNQSDAGGGNSDENGSPSDHIGQLSPGWTTRSNPPLPRPRHCPFSPYVSTMAVGWAQDGAVQDQIDATVDSAVKRARSRLAQGESLLACEECGEPIPEARRQALPGVRRCVPCQSEADRLDVHQSLYNRRGSKDSQLK
jgi:phage/conjugal plasmid C-4 type zinc finger TraR family protein